MTNKDWISKAERVLMSTYAQQPLVLVRGEGCRLWDEAGNEYLDFVAGLAVCNLGHAHPAIARAAAAQLSELVHVSNLYYTTPQIELAEAITHLTFADRVFFCNSGAEAIEGAIKLCRRYAREHLGPKRHRIICMHNSFHGRTFGALSATGQEKFWQGFDPLLPGFTFVPFDDVQALADAIDETACAVMLEPIQGEGGVKLPSPDFLLRVRRLCYEHKLLLVLDEVQTGLGRTGKFLAHEHFGIQPDIMAVAKALANGLPMGALLAKEEVAQAFSPGSHASTFGGGPVIAAAARVALGILSSPDFLVSVRDKGAYLKERLEKFKERFDIIKEVRGLGLMWGIELAAEGTPLVTACRERGFLVNCTQGNIIRLLPPLIVAREDLDRGLGLLAESLKATFS